MLRTRLMAGVSGRKGLPGGRKGKEDESTTLTTERQLIKYLINFQYWEDGFPYIS